MLPGSIGYDLALEIDQISVSVSVSVPKLAINKVSVWFRILWDVLYSEFLFRPNLLSGFGAK